MVQGSGHVVKCCALTRWDVWGGGCRAGGLGWVVGYIVTDADQGDLMLTLACSGRDGLWVTP